MPSRVPEADRLWARVIRGPGCWEWTGYSDAKGYGQIGVGSRVVLTHRLSWELTNGPIPVGLCVLHRCDNPPCVRPDHLFLGTIAENNADMRAKGRERKRGAVGERNASAKLTVADVATIRQERRRGVRLSDLARRFGVTATAVSFAADGITWRHCEDLTLGAIVQKAVPALAGARP